MNMLLSFYGWISINYVPMEIYICCGQYKVDRSKDWIYDRSILITFGHFVRNIYKLTNKKK